jgi:hypothetical protein
MLVSANNPVEDAAAKWTAILDRIDDIARDADTFHREICKQGPEFYAEVNRLMDSRQRAEWKRLLARAGELYALEERK